MCHQDRASSPSRPLPRLSWSFPPDRRLAPEARPVWAGVPLAWPVQPHVPLVQQALVRWVRRVRWVRQVLPPPTLPVWVRQWQQVRQAWPPSCPP
jgi:hypothetical protein